MAEANIETDLNNLKKMIKSEKLIIGTERTMKGLKAGTLTKVYLSSNAPQQVSEDVAHYSKIDSVEVVRLTMPNDELGTFCKKPFSVSVLGILK